MNTSLDVNWMTSSLIIYAKFNYNANQSLNKNMLQLFDKIYSYFLFSTPFIITLIFYLRQQTHVSANIKKIGCSFAENKIFEKFKMADML